MSHYKIVIENDLRKKTHSVKVLQEFKIGDLDFFVHRSYYNECYGGLFNFEYTVSHKQTGAGVSSHNTIDEAITYAIIEYNFRGAKVIKDVIKKRIKLKGKINV